MKSRSDSIRLSEKHGVNPSVTVCPFCFQDVGVALFGLLPNDEEAPRRVADSELCDECKNHMRQGFLIRERDRDMMTGRLWVVRTETMEEMFGEEFASQGHAWITPDQAQAMGLYERENQEDA